MRRLSTLPHKDAGIPAVRKVKVRKKTGHHWPAGKRLDYEALEKAKVLIEKICYTEIAIASKRKFWKEVRVSILPWSKSGYIDVRTYINDKPTGRGVLLHLDHLRPFVDAVVRAEREVNSLRAQGLMGDNT